MKKIIIIMFLCTFLCACTYFEVKDAIKYANKGEYITSLNNLAGILRDSRDDRRTLDAFEMIYPDAEKRYYDEIVANKDFNKKLYTKAMINLLKVQDIYFSLPEASKNQIALITPPLTERNELKKEIAHNFLLLGEKADKKGYLSKLEAYGYFENAKKYDTLGNKEILKKYGEARKEAQGIFKVTFENNFYDKYLPIHLEQNFKEVLGKYSLFSLEKDGNANLIFNVYVTDYIYSQPNIDIQTGIDSYTDTRERTVMRKVTETVTKDGKDIKITKWVPEIEYVDVDIYYRYKKFTKTTYISYNLNYILKEKDGTVISQKYKQIKVEDKVSWTKYYPYSPMLAFDSFKFPISENEKNTISESELIKKGIFIGTDELKKVLDELEEKTDIKL
ncbi:hypothetical protein [Fusobacterium sp.]|uniref:hypothetical protein n=1 Tax=Fusobacterium sp. TaxID=68766 RepID=UPI00396C5D56